MRKAFATFIQASLTSVTKTEETIRAPFLCLAAALFAAGCASTADCGGDWYAKGWSDGRYGAFAQADLYARRCPGVDADAYNRGWRDGNAARPALGGM